jgi:predicted oxidoreductase
VRERHSATRPRARRRATRGPPYYVIEVVPAITNTWSGLTIDQHARVLNVDGVPIPGLLAAVADAGGIYHRAYAGGLAAALAFGLEAARTALAVGARVS